MKLEQFEQVLEIVKTGSFSQAARNLYMSQPNLSLSIKQLEKELGCLLFDRSRGRVIPTEQGKELIEHMMRIQSNYEILKTYSEKKEPSRLSLRVATVNLNHTIPFFIQIVQNHLKDSINFSHYNYLTIDDVIERVASCQADIGLIGCIEPYLKSILAKLESVHITYTPLSESSVCAVIGEKNEFYGTRSSLTTADLASQTILTYGNESLDPNSALYNFSELRIAGKGRISVNNNYLFYELIHNTEAVGLVSSSMNTVSRAKYWPELIYLPVTDYPDLTEVGWIRLTQMPLPPAAQEFIAALQKAY